MSSDDSNEDRHRKSKSRSEDNRKGSDRHSQRSSHSRRSHHRSSRSPSESSRSRGDYNGSKYKQSRRRDRCSRSPSASSSGSEEHQRKSQRATSDKIRKAKEQRKQALDAVTVNETSVLASSSFRPNQEIIDQINSDSFTPQEFVSGRLPMDSTEKGDEFNEMECFHNSAIFGPESNRPVISFAANKPSQKILDVPKIRFPLAHPSLSEDPEIRQQRWHKKFFEMRKQLILQRSS